MKTYMLYVIVLITIFINSCQKEVSVDINNAPSDGTLSDGTGNCLSKTVNGTYVAGTSLAPTTNTIQVTINVSQTGSYVIYSDTTNGYYFRATGIFTSTGSKQVALKGSGTPLTSGTNNFTIHYDSTICPVAVTVLPAGTGGAAAVFTIASSGSPANCSGATATGNYIIGTALNSNNKVTLSVNVTTIGTYNVSTTAVNGITFSASGAFAALGAQTLVLTGSGTPTGAAGTVTISVTAGSSTCSFQVTKSAGAAFSFNCSSAVVDGTYETGISLNTTNTVDIDVNVTAAGPYNITTTAINGMTFTASGTFSTTGINNIQLTGSGTPASTGTFNVSVPGTTSCTFPVTVSAGPVISWSFKQGSTTHQGSIDNTQLSAISGFTTFNYSGSNSDETLVFSIVDLAGGINNSETYNSATTTGNSSGFLFKEAGGDIWTADNATTGASVIFKITSHNTSAKTISGTFSGTVKNFAGTVLSITAGTFSATYN
jgi:hypothetical protein